MRKTSSGILMYKLENGDLKVLLVHPGGPFWAKKDLGAWSIPKGEYEEGEDPLAAAVREFSEETGQDVDVKEVVSLGTVKQASGKVVNAWALRGDFDVSTLVSNTFEMEWPRKSGNIREFPEVDRAEWFDPALAKQKIIGAQGELIDRLIQQLKDDGISVVDSGPTSERTHCSDEDASLHERLHEVDDQ